MSFLNSLRNYLGIEPRCYKRFPNEATCGRANPVLVERRVNVTCQACLHELLNRSDRAWSKFCSRLNAVRQQRNDVVDAVGSPDKTPASVADAARKLRTELFALRTEVNDLRQRENSKPRKELLNELHDLRALVIGTKSGV